MIVALSAGDGEAEEGAGGDVELVVGGDAEGLEA